MASISNLSRVGRAQPGRRSVRSDGKVTQLDGSAGLCGVDRGQFLATNGRRCQQVVSDGGATPATLDLCTRDRHAGMRSAAARCPQCWVAAEYPLARCRLLLDDSDGDGRGVHRRRRLRNSSPTLLDLDLHDGRPCRTGHVPVGADGRSVLVQRLGRVGSPDRRYSGDSCRRGCSGGFGWWHRCAARHQERHRAPKAAVSADDTVSVEWPGIAAFQSPECPPYCGADCAPPAEAAAPAPSTRSGPRPLHRRSTSRSGRRCHLVIAQSVSTASGLYNGSARSVDLWRTSLASSSSRRPPAAWSRAWRASP